MNKKITVILLIVLFISANVVTFIFAQGKAKIVEKVVTVYKNIDSKEASLPIGSESAKADAKGSVKSESGVARNVDFDDSDYFLGSGDADLPAAAEITAGTANVEKGKEEEVNAETASVANAGHQNISSDSNSLNTYAPNVPQDIPPAEETYVPDESIPIPQLPLCDKDFESDIDDSDSCGIPLPRLPDIS